ncbi:MAG: alpha/beta hydrolase [Clostridia bacterium]
MIYIVIGLVVVLLIVIIVMLVGNFFYNIALNVKTSKSFIFKHTDHDCQEEVDKKKQRQEDQKWLEENAQDVYTKANNGGLKLHGYQIKQAQNNNNRWAILIHGYTADAIEMTSAAKCFLSLGYQILMVDLRGHGKSEGTYIGMGWPDRLDILDWIEWIVEQQTEAEIILYGVSMGAATVMMTMGEERLSKNVKLAIEDCGYTSVWEEFCWELKTLFKLPAFPVLYAANFVAKVRAGYDLKKASSIEQLKKAKIPLLLIHGEDDKFVPFFMQEQLMHAGNGVKEKLVIKGAAHAECAKINPTLYWKTVEQFIDKYANTKEVD